MRAPDTRAGQEKRAGSVDSEFMELESGAIAYLLGRNGATKQRLANFSGCRLEIDPNKDGSAGRIEIIGTPEERKLARLCIDITLQQRNNGYA
jgi:rRNA processing protein Krr1/Pno1